jgi:GNAT superfamily N-acetyltransferase
MDDHPPRGWHDALAFAARQHGNDLRKGSRIPYLTHVVAVAETLARHYPDRDELVIAGLLHDVVEDTNASFADLRAAFGAEVERLVRAVSKDDAAMLGRLGTTREAFLAGLDKATARRRLWRARREYLLALLAEGDDDVLRLKAADTYANLASLQRDLRASAAPGEIWKHFEVGRDESLWFYGAVVDSVARGLPDEPLARALRALEGEVRRESVDLRQALGDGATIRRAGLADVDMLVPLFDAYRSFYGRHADEGLARAYLPERLAGGQATALVAEDEGGAGLGFALLYPSFSSVAAAPLAILNDLFVTPAARGRGVGRALLTAAADVAREMGAARLTLRTQTTNVVAQSLYASTGWRLVDDFLSYDFPLGR